MERRPPEDEKDMQREEEMQPEGELRDEGTASERFAEASPARDEQLTVPEDRDAAAMAEGRQPSVMPQLERHAAEVFAEADLDGYRRRWDTLQASFVDDPRAATEQAGALAGEVVRRLSERYGALRSEFPGESEQAADTEVLRHTIRGYRSIVKAVVG